jgi:hypothetical protein
MSRASTKPKENLSKSDNKFIVAGDDKYTINWRTKVITHPPYVRVKLNECNPEILYPIYRDLLSRGYKAKAKEVYNNIEPQFERVVYYNYTTSKKNKIDWQKINEFIEFLKKKKVNFIHTVQDYTQRTEGIGGGIRSIVHFKRIELLKILGEKECARLNLHYVRSISEHNEDETFIHNGLELCEMEEDEIYWADSESTYYSEGKEILKKKLISYNEVKQLILGPEDYADHHLVDSMEPFPDFKKPKLKHVKVWHLGWSGMEQIHIQLPENFPSKVLTVDDWCHPKVGELCINLNSELDVVKRIYSSKHGKMRVLQNYKSHCGEGLTHRVLVKKGQIFKFAGKTFVYKKEKKEE